MLDEISRLEQQIEAAFGELPIPPVDRLVIDNSGQHLECNQVKAKFRGRHWRELSVEDLQYESEALAFFSPEAFRFFLPAFIRAALLHYDQADLIPMNVVSWFTPSDDPQLKPYRRERTESLTANQKAVVLRFIRYLRETHAADFSSEELEKTEKLLSHS